VINDSRWWGRFAKKLGWHLYGFTYRSFAQFVVPGDQKPLCISGNVKRQIEAAIRAAGKAMVANG